MADTNGPAADPPRRDDLARYQPPGGCPCGVGGCLVLMVVVSAVLLAVVVVMALLRPGMTPVLPGR